VFERSGVVWTQTAKLVEPAPRRGAIGSAPRSVLSGSRVVAGAPFRTDDDASDGGSVFQFVHDAFGWHASRLVATGAAAGDQFGTSVAVDADGVFVGSPLRDGTGADAGRAHLFAVETPLTASDATAGDGFGRSIAVDGDSAVVGAPFDASNAGSAYVFVRTDGAWSQTGETLASSDAAAGDAFGTAVAIDGDTVVVGARLADVGGNADAGAAYVFVRIAGAWTQQAKLVSSDGGGRRRVRNVGRR